LGFGKTEIFFRRGLDRANQLEPPQQIAVYAHAILDVVSPAKRSGIANHSTDLPDETGARHHPQDGMTIFI
jgi:hypothetical protein